MTRGKKTTHHDIVIQRAYDEPTPHDGYRVLVDRFWPRGRSKTVLQLDAWLRELAPSTQLIKWFGHEPTRWEEFRKRYRAELDGPGQREHLRALLGASGNARLTLVYGARDERHNQAVVLREVLEALR